MNLTDQRASREGRGVRVRRVSVTDPIAAARHYDYADSFELRLEGPDRCSPEEWVRAGVDATPAWIKRIAGAGDGLGSARIVESDANVVVLEDSDSLMDTVMVGRNVEPERRVLTTVLRYRRPLLARAVWAFVGILHRRTARQVVTGGRLREAERATRPKRRFTRSSGHVRMSGASSSSEGRRRVVVVGGGFGGLQAVRGLRRAPVDLTLIDRRNFHLFQPLLYQVATGALSAGEIASPLRAILKHQRNARVVLGDVSGFDLEQRCVLLSGGGSGDEGAIAYDTLVVATGAGHAYFGHDDWRPLAPGLKTLEDAIAIRARILAAFEAAEIEPDPDRKRALLTFAVVGGGPTGVEMAGQIAEIARDTLRRDFRNIDPRAARILLVEAADRVLTGFPERLSARAARALERLGVTPLLDRSVVDIDSRSITVQDRDGRLERISAQTTIWAAGVRASGLAGMLGEATGAPVDRAGRVTVESDLTLRGHPEVFALGDMVQVQDTDGRVAPLPGVAPVAMQQGRYAAKVIRARLNGRERRPFRYIDKGNVATIGRLRAVVDLRGVQLSGTLAWLAYLVVHLYYLVGLQNRVLVFIRWTVSFVTRGRGARLITGQGREAAPATGSHERVPVRVA